MTKTKNELHERWSYKTQLPGIVSTKERENEAERTLGSSRLGAAGAGGGSAELRGVWLCKLSPAPRRERPRSSESPRGDKMQQHGLRVEARKREWHSEQS